MEFRRMPHVEFDALSRAHRAKERRRAYPLAVMACAKVNQYLPQGQSPATIEDFMPFREREGGDDGQE